MTQARAPTPHEVAAKSPVNVHLPGAGREKLLSASGSPNEPSRLANEPALRRARAAAGPHALNLGPVAAHGLCLGYESRCPAAPTPFLAGSRLSRT